MGPTAQNVIVQDTLPPYVTFQSFTQGPSGSVNGGVLTWNLGDLSAGNYVLKYTAKLDDFMPGGVVLENHAELTHALLSSPLVASARTDVRGDFIVRVQVFNEAGEVVKTLRVAEFSRPLENVDVLEDNRISFWGDAAEIYYRGVLIGTWDGTNDRGEPVGRGEYHIKIDNVDPFGVVQSVTRTITVEWSLHEIRVAIYNEAGEVVRRLFQYFSNPDAGITFIELSSPSITPGYGTASGPKELRIRLSNGSVLTWDGRSDAGDFVTSGEYYIEVRSVDGQGGETIVVRKVAVLSSDTFAASLQLEPNVVKRAEGNPYVRIRPLAGFAVKGAIYTTAGELVRRFEGQALGAPAVLDTTGLAAGYYIVAVEVYDAFGRVERQIKRLVIF